MWILITTSCAVSKGYITKCEVIIFFRVVYYVLSFGSNSSPKMVPNKIITYYNKHIIIM